jgi:hypothetical protein
MPCVGRNRADAQRILGPPAKGRFWWALPSVWAAVLQANGTPRRDPHSTALQDAPSRGLARPICIYGPLDPATVLHPMAYDWLVAERAHGAFANETASLMLQHFA